MPRKKVEPDPEPAAVKPMTKKAEADAKRVVASAEQRRAGNQAMARRRRWESAERPPSPGSKYPGIGGRERMTSMQDVEMQHREEFIRGNPNLYPDRDLEAEPVRPIPTAQLYGARGIPGQHTQDPGRLHDVGEGAMQPQMQIPGLRGSVHGEGAATVGRPTHVKQREIEGRVRAKTGATHESMRQALGAQIDQAHMRGGQHGVPPAAHDFYVEGQPHQVIKEGAKGSRCRLRCNVSVECVDVPEHEVSVGRPAHG